MNVKTLLLGSAAALMVAGGAHAADLTVAEPVDYVKVCDAFGAGFYYSPGTDTCIKVGGYVKFGTNANNTDSDITEYSYGTGKSHWGSFYTEASVQLTASSVTEYGNLTGWVDLRAKTGSGYSYAAGSDTDAHIDSAYIELGGLKAGHFTSAFDFLGGYTDFGAFRADSSTDHIQYSYALGSFGLVGSIEDGSDRIGDLTYLDASNSKPDLVGALTYVAGPINAKLSAAYVNNETYNSNDTGYAVQLGVEVTLDNISKGDKFGIQGVYSDNAFAYSGYQKFFGSYALDSGAAEDGKIYGGFVSYLHYWNPSLWSAVEASYLHSANDDYPNSVWQVSASTDWAIVKNLDLMVDGSYAEGNFWPKYVSYYPKTKEWSLNVWLKRSW